MLRIGQVALLLARLLALGDLWQARRRSSFTRGASAGRVPLHAATSRDVIALGCAWISHVQLPNGLPRTGTRLRFEPMNSARETRALPISKGAFLAGELIDDTAAAKTARSLLIKVTHILTESRPEIRFVVTWTCRATGRPCLAQ